MRLLNKNNFQIRYAGRCVAASFIFWVIVQGFSFSEDIRYQSGDRRDPFIPVSQIVSTVAAATGIQIEGIIYDGPDKSIVVINGEPYKAGQSVGEYNIVAIYPSRITVELKGVQSDYWISSAEEEIAQNAKK